MTASKHVLHLILVLLLFQAAIPAIYEFNCISRSEDGELSWLFDNDRITMSPVLDNGPAIRIKLNFDTTRNDYRSSRRIQKSFPIIPVSSFRFDFAFDTIRVLDTLTFAKYVSWGKSYKGWTVGLFAFVTDDFKTGSFQEHLFRSQLVFLRNEWHLVYLVETSGRSGIWQEKVSDPLRPNTPYCLEYLLELGPDSTTKQLEFRINGKSTWKIGLEKLAFKIKQQTLLFNTGELLNKYEGTLYFSCLAFGDRWLGNPPRTPVIRGPAQEMSFAAARRIRLVSPAYQDFLVPARHTSSQFQIQTPGGDWELPLFDSGEDSLSKDSIAIPHGLNPAGAYVWRVRHLNADGNRSDWSEPSPLPFRVIPDSGLPSYPAVLDAHFSLPGKSKQLTRLETGTWYDLTLKLSEPSGWDSLAYTIFWCNNSGYTGGNIANRGGKFLSRDNYIYNISFGPTKAFEKKDEGQYKTTPVMGIQGLYLDASAKSLAVNRADSTIRFRIRFMENAGPGKWSLRGFLKNNMEQSSWLYYGTFTLVGKSAGAGKGGNSRVIPK